MSIDHHPAQAPHYEDNNEGAPLSTLENNREQEKDRKKIGRIGIASAAIGGLAGAVVLGGGMFLLKKTGEDALEAGLGAPPSVSAPEVDGQYQGVNPEIDSSSIDVSTYPHSSFAELPFAMQLDKVIPVVEERIKNGAVDEYRDALERVNAFELKGGVGTGNINDDPQEIMNRTGLKSYIFYTETDLNLAKNLVSGAYLPGIPPYESAQSSIGNGKDNTPAPTQVFESSPVFTQGSFAGVEANGTPTRVIMAVSTASGKVFESVIQERQSHEDPKRTETIVVKSILEGQQGFTENLANLKPTPLT